MNKAVKNRIIRTAILAVVGLAIGAGVAWYQMQFQTAQVIRQGDSAAANTGPVAGLKLGGPFTLVDQDGNPVNERTYEGQYKLIYFGFTYCPAICPTELQKMTKVLNTLGPYADNIQPLFISVDPERDTPVVMKDYVSLFHPRLVGLTGTVPQVENVKQKYRIFATKVQEEGMSDYTMDHSSFIYLMGPQDELVSIYRIKDSADFMVEDIRKKVVLGRRQG